MQKVGAGGARGKWEVEVSIVNCEVLESGDDLFNFKMVRASHTYYGLKLGLIRARVHLRAKLL